MKYCLGIQKVHFVNNFSSYLICYSGFSIDRSLFSICSVFPFPLRRILWILNWSTLTFSSCLIIIYLSFSTSKVTCQKVTMIDLKYTYPTTSPMNLRFLFLKIYRMFILKAAVEAFHYWKFLFHFAWFSISFASFYLELMKWPQYSWMTINYLHLFIKFATFSNYQLDSELLPMSFLFGFGGMNSIGS